MDKEEANDLGMEIASNFVDCYRLFLRERHFSNARALVLSTFPYIMATIPPSKRDNFMTDLFSTFAEIGKETFEDAEDLYTFITKESKERE